MSRSWFDIPHLLHICWNHVRIDGKHELIVKVDVELKIFADEYRIEQVLVGQTNYFDPISPILNNL